MAAYLLMIGDREALGWILTEQRMAFPDFQRSEVRALAPDDTLFLYTTRGCFKNPTRDRGRVIAAGTARTSVTTLDEPVELAGRTFPIGCHVDFSTATGWLDGVELGPLVEDIDKVRPRLDLAYIRGSTAEGVLAGLAVSGGQIVASGGAVAGAGAGAAPGAATVVSAMAADAAAVLVASERMVAHVAAYYGYDIDDPGERLYALGVLGVGTASDVGKGAAFLELNGSCKDWRGAKRGNSSAGTRSRKLCSKCTSS